MFVIDCTKLQNIATGKVDNYINGTFLSLGTNLGNKTSNLKTAILLLKQNGCSVEALSPVYQCTPWHMPSSADFYNMVAKIKHGFEPQELLSKLQSIEKAMGRIKQNNGYEDRIIDIDILYINGIVVCSESLQIPHPHVAQRLFVLKPLHHLLPNGIHPTYNQSTTAMLEACTDNGVCKELGDLSAIND
jgi:2-amino-4-hydroxy-6-hydroxymethyldihydropteridine diphosphokinase